MNNTLEQQLVDLRNEKVNERIYDSTTQVNIDMLKVLVKKAEDSDIDAYTKEEVDTKVETVKDFLIKVIGDSLEDYYTPEQIDTKVETVKDLLIKFIKDSLKDYYTPEQIEQFISQLNRKFDNVITTENIYKYVDGQYISKEVIETIIENKLSKKCQYIKGLIDDLDLKVRDLTKRVDKLEDWYFKQSPYAQYVELKNEINKLKESLKGSLLVKSKGQWKLNTQNTTNAYERRIVC